MKKKLFLFTFIAVFNLMSLSACSTTGQTKNNKAPSKTESKTTSSSFESPTNSVNKAIISGEKTTASPLSGYSTELIEYARVTETIINYYKYNFQPASINVIKNGLNHQVFPYDGSEVIHQETVTLSFSSDNTMAGTTIITYSSNHDGSINFYRNPNHYQDERYLKDSTWVKEASKKLLNGMKTIQIPVSFDNKAAQIISKIEVE